MRHTHTTHTYVFESAEIASRLGLPLPGTEDTISYQIGNPRFTVSGARSEKVEITVRCNIILDSQGEYGEAYKMHKKIMTGNASSD